MNDEQNKLIRVVHVIDEFRIVINLGRDDGIKEGSVYLIYAKGPQITDPDTNENLGNLEVVRGRATVSHVQDKMATLVSAETEVVSGPRKIIRRGGPTLLWSNQREEVEEMAERVMRELNCEIGDFAKLI